MICHLLALSVAQLPPVTSVAQLPAVFGQGVLVGEVTAVTAIVQVRLTKGTSLVDGKAFEDGDALRDGDLPGQAGSVRFSYMPKGATHPMWTPYLEATPNNDFIARAVFSSLTPGTRYSCTAETKGQEGSASVQFAFEFNTLPGVESSAATRFHVVTGMNYDKFFAPKGYTKKDRDLGYPACDAMSALHPDFIVYTGDNVYYDKPPKTKAVADLRAKWHRQFSRPRMIALQAQVPAYWMKDDHDHRTNDSDGAGSYFPSHERGLRTFREQVPILPHGDDDSPTYRTHRISKDLQIWLLEGRDYRSPNKMEDGPDKTLWGADQTRWLKRTLQASSATHKMIISPTPMVGPDDSYKRDNHTNHRGFRHEGDAFKEWAREQELWTHGAFLLCGDRHWQYHSVDSTGAHEFSSGAICDANSRIGRKPGGKKSTDPEALIQQPYSQKERSGGFLSVVCVPAQKAEPASVRFEFYDEHGALLYSFRPKPR